MTKDIIAQINASAKSDIAVLGKDVECQHIESMPTGILPLDYALGNGGFPKGLISEIHGLPSSGKSTICLQLISYNQKKGVTCAWIDAEHSFDFVHAKNLGVDTDSLIFVQPDYGEQVVETMEELIKAKVGIIIVDSVSGIVPLAELEGQADQPTMGGQARLISKLCRKIVAITKKNNTVVVFINQMRQNIMGGQWEPYTVTGGMALKHYASIRLEAKRKGTLKVEEKEVGYATKFRVVKNKTSFPGKSCDINYLHKTGFEKEGDIAELAVEKGILKLEGRTYSFKEQKIASSHDATNEAIKNNPILKAELLGLLFSPQ